MVQRCRNPKNRAFANYGGRGITVCDEWARSFAAFRDWAYAVGYGPGVEMDRIDVDGHYTPANCRFITATQNQRNKRNNRRVSAFGETKTVADWVDDDRCSVRYATLYARLEDGWDVERAITQARWGTP